MFKKKKIKDTVKYEILQRICLEIDELFRIFLICFYDLLLCYLLSYRNSSIDLDAA